jgi:hypothetical protein
MQCTAPVRSTVRVMASLIVMFAITAGLASAAEQRVQGVKYSSVEVHGIKVFYREAGPADGPADSIAAWLPRFVAHVSTTTTIRHSTQNGRRTCASGSRPCSWYGARTIRSSL